MSREKIGGEINSAELDQFVGREDAAEGHRGPAQGVLLGRNRYDNVYCLDKTRVKLTAEPNANDYIHANYVDTPLKDHRFICTQGPTTTSITDFWRMVWQEHVQFIIMLSNFEENGREKCAHYFPEKSGATIQFDQFIICCVYCSRMTDSKYSILCRELSLKVDGDARAVAIKHFQWAEWPDHGVPETDRSVLRVLDKVRMSNRPIVVHCSAGIGRSGVVITIECVLEAMYSQEDCSDMLALLKQLRQQRAGLVQTVQVRFCCYDGNETLYLGEDGMWVVN
ncbi:unnamed protein product [Toxocara canis]|uniref:Protein-tyrosine phosphatase n=1 Tax=Toxocara canis TaxID=6265 RepID=A0A183V9R0_TOXCA|nr:unnamed protein product [Toxocara canis]